MHNRLADETSPYLLQHADNPVHWQPWDETALEQARREDRPILLSIGYSACHWCHVMAHESFEDPGTAELMNALYVNIKIDREERPDLDHIYQIAHQLMTGRPGGWPLTVFVKPDDQIPIFSGTYFPKQDRYGMPSFTTVLTRVERYYRENGAEIARHGALVTDAFRRLGAPAETAPHEPSRAPIHRAREQLGEAVDAVNGGFGSAPKFPHPTNLDFLLRHWQRSAAEAAPDEGALEIVAHSLTRMARGGLYDQLGGGFFRYSVDAEWSIPHFEKMLYDNAALLALYSDAYAATREPLFARVAGETADWITSDMEHADGGYFSTRDADSEGEEGKYYLWTRAELDDVLDEPERSAAAAYFGLDGPANFEGRAWHLHAPAPAERVAAQLGADTNEASARIESARARLLAARSKRVPPERDDKRLVSWNGLTIRALARAARRLGRPELAESATRAVDFIAARLWDGARLLACYKDGRARFTAYLDDYAFLAAGLVELLEQRWRADDLRFARALADAMLAHFEDPEGGFFFVADDHESLIHRPKILPDEAVPSGNGIAACTLLALGHLLGEPRYLDAAHRTITAAMASIERHPQAHATLLEALSLDIDPPELVIVRAQPGDADAWRAAAEATFTADRLTFVIPAAETGLPGLLAERTGGEQTTAYVCRGASCDAPTTDLRAFRSALRR